MNGKTLAFLLIVYLPLSILTFGKAYNNAMTDGYAPASAFSIGKEERAHYRALGAALLWPLYWSAVLQEQK